MKLRSTRYFTGKPCIRGHIAERMRSTRVCVECLKLRKKYKRHTERTNARRRERYANDLVYKNKIDLHNKLYTKTNKHRAWKQNWSASYYAKNSNVMLAKKQAFYQKNKETYRRYYNDRRARKFKASGCYSNEDIEALMTKQRGLCLCGVSFKFAKRTIDHKTPLSRGGSNWPRNLQLLCQPCNDSKGVKTQQEWTRKLQYARRFL